MDTSEPEIVLISAYSEQGPGNRLYGRSGGVFSYRIDTQDKGRLHKLDHVSIAGTYFHTTHPDKKYFYTGRRVSGGIITGYKFDSSTGKFTELNSQSSEGVDPSYVSTDHTGSYVLVANGREGTIALLPVNEDGTLSPATDVVEHEGSSVDPYYQYRPNPHAIRPGPENRFIYVPDRGIDRIMIYRFNGEDGKLEPAETEYAELPSGSGPRHLEFHPNGKYAYIINELNSTITGFRYDPETGDLRKSHTVSTVPAEFNSDYNHCADIQIHPSGKWLYGSNRGHDSIAIFEVQENGKLRKLGHESIRGHWPRSFTLAPSGTFLYVANRRSDSVSRFTIDSESGGLTAREQKLSLPEPVYITAI